MLVETYEIEVLAAGADAAATEEMKSLAIELGLNGQQDLYDTPSGSPIPYREMTKREAFVYTTLCPNTCSPEKYKRDVIPLRVMQVIAHARSLNYFEDLCIMYPTPGTIKDPVLIGHKKDGYETKRFLLARWGEELDSLETLAVLAGKVWLAKARVAAQDSIAKVNAFRARIDTLLPEDVSHLDGHDMICTFGA